MCKLEVGKTYKNDDTANTLFECVHIAKDGSQAVLEYQNAGKTRMAVCYKPNWSTYTEAKPKIKVTTRVYKLIHNNSIINYGASSVVHPKVFNDDNWIDYTYVDVINEVELP